MRFPLSVFVFLFLFSHQALAEGLAGLDGKVFVPSRGGCIYLVKHHPAQRRLTLLAVHGVAGSVYAGCAGIGEETRFTACSATACQRMLDPGADGPEGKPRLRAVKLEAGPDGGLQVSSEELPRLADTYTRDPAREALVLARQAASEAERAKQAAAEEAARARANAEEELLNAGSAQ